MIKNRKLIGRRDKLDFPELGLIEISAKVDTGAYTSSIHCHDIKPFMDGDTQMVSFCILDPEHEQYDHKSIVMPVNKVRKVKSSNGSVEKRFSIKTKVRIYKKNYSVELTLTDRSDMKYPVLLGRKLLNKKFLVDVSEIDLSFNSKQV